MTGPDPEPGLPASPDEERQHRMADTVRLVVTRRERAARSPAMERALKRLIWRYARAPRAALDDPPADAGTPHPDSDQRDSLR